MEQITLYSTHCPKCKILQKKLDDKKIQYTLCEDIEVMKSKNIMSAPMLGVNDKILDFYNAVKFVNDYKG